MKISNFKSGQILIIAAIFLTVILILTAALFTRVAGFLRFGSNSILREQATNLAEAGVDNAIWQLNETAGTYTGESNTPLGTTGTFTVTIQEKTPPNPQLKTIVSTGYIPNATSPRAKQTIKVDAQVNSEGASFRYATQTLEGGITMSNSSRINGSVYSNGNIAAGVGGSQVITGDAWAVGNIDEPPIDVMGTTNPGASPQPAPTVDYDFWKDKADDGGITTCSPKCTIDYATPIGSQKYVGDLEITGNVTVTMNGPIWVAKDGFGNGGNFSMSQGLTKLKLNEGFGSNGTVLIADGNIDLTQGGTLEPTSASPKGYIMLVTTSTDSTAVQISQSGATGIFYALVGGGVLSQSAHVASLIAKTLTMTQSSTLDYDTGLASATFSVGPGGSWQIKKGTYRFTSSP
ncbi:hypothetical protein A2697_00015 [Candidatus Curtissbacteria bacterium RIFCSPHIGHO2_01_FULL_41_44]|uniref:Type 4 fimbrial biogenesis protein PilX N-terminal domain-containing protein n=1 Tax=Candidatus Curtissbacteria bacterium RIFCSPLOWO2_01_FULL_42_50 TaxID=1797730 RepID=A0A1F5H6U7_9BACT|nr:MAG: hypothetical protein A3C33_01860 [Candidatus Curtissbacteria bacterium RIFCSPHIGHO2_02_FULL_42_58]OGD94387.1 MAG: hypothetical protein A2697_00015 [Candidatus Curtissbacteria bacterium RIFCSPHIGHO2_01_FULL_41_44]OGD97661.1 MAG: hypothetical protein A3E71_00940 [Candidatus Curtissbacteria bacterium RIFCSPHIGHO2_12_FULL_42_33]OGD99892.1 MAG: hypothetical protein A3B54_00015 [Candidatus Curtissbacteria bacterium RIFCSPLOWO2_01_FULL_42_50]OGE02751.1 MAG: hypothetical protein A3G16_02980 [Ca